MSERPDGVVPSDRQPIPRARGRVIDTKVSVIPDTLEGVGPEEGAAPPQPPSGLPKPEAVGDDGKPKRDTHPWAEGEEEGEAGEKRDTQPWRDDEDAPEAGPTSLRTEFDAEMRGAPPSAEAKIHEEHRAFRHRGPFTRAQAELAVSQAPDVQMVLEVLVRYARQFFERCVLLVVQHKRGALRVSHGLTADLASFAVQLDEPSVFSEAVETGDPVMRPLAREGLDAEIKKQLRVGDERVAVVPLQIRERVVALFYGDDRNDGVDKDAVADVTDFTEICAQEITRIIIRRKRRRATLPH